MQDAANNALRLESTVLPLQACIVVLLPLVMEAMVATSFKRRVGSEAREPTLGLLSPDAPPHPSRSEEPLAIESDVLLLHCFPALSFAPTKDTGALYTIGSGGTYCLGSGTGGKSQTRNQPEQVMPLSGTEVAHIACGTSHMAALLKQ